MHYVRNWALAILGGWALASGLAQLKLFALDPKLLGGLGVVGGLLLVVSVFGGKDPEAT